MSAPQCPVHLVPMRPGKAGTPWASTWSCSEWVGVGEEGANQNGYCNQRSGQPTQGGGRPAQRPAPRPAGPNPAPAASVASSPSQANLRALAMEAASRVFQGAGVHNDAGVGLFTLAEQIHDWLTQRTKPVAEGADIDPDYEAWRSR